MDKIYVVKPSLPPLEEYIEYLKVIWKNNWLTNNGPLHKKLSEQLTEYLKVDNLSLFNNGHSALDIAIKGLKLTGEVITTPFTFASTTHAIVLNGLTPVFCDINSTDYTIDVDKIEALITEKTSAIIPVHVYGVPCDVMKIKEIAEKYSLKVIYDAAHTFGVRIKGVGIGNFGDVSMFSLHATKVFNTIEGGILAFKDTFLKELFDSLKNFGISGDEVISHIGINAKMNEFQAAMGLANLGHIEDEINTREKIAYRYIELFDGIKGINVLNYKSGIKYNYIYFPILINENEFGANRDNIYEELKKYNIYSRKYFYPLVTDFDCYKGSFPSQKTPAAEYVAQRILTLPMYSGIENDEISLIYKIIKSLYKVKIGA